MLPNDSLASLLHHFLIVQLLERNSSNITRARVNFAKKVSSLDDIKQGGDETLASYYCRFNKNLVEIDQVISRGEIVLVFVRGLVLVPKGDVFSNCISSVPIYNLVEMTERVKTYVNLERSKEDGTPRKETRKSIAKGRNMSITFSLEK